MQRGFTLIELIIVILILSVLAVVAAPRFLDLSRDAKIASLHSIASQMRATNSLVQNVARLRGLRPADVNPASSSTGTSQPEFIVDFGWGSTEVFWSNLCPEAEEAYALTYFEFIQITQSRGLSFETSPQYAYVGYQFDVQPFGVQPTNNGCYASYNSFDVNCSVVVVTEDC